VDDQHTADLICTECAHVVSGPVGSAARAAAAATAECSPRSSSPAAGSAAPPRRARPTRGLNAATVLLRETVLDVCSLLHLEGSACLVDTAVHILQKQLGVVRAQPGRPYTGITRRRRKEEEEEEEEEEKKLELSDGKFRIKLAYAIYEALNRQGTPRSPHAIAALCDVPPGKLLRLEKEFNLRPSYCPPSQYVETMCTMLELPFFVSGIATMLCKHLQDYFYGAKNEALVVVCVLAAVERVRELGFEKGGADFAPHVTQANLCRLFDVRSRSLLRLREYLPGFTLQMFCRGTSTITTRGSYEYNTGSRQEEPNICLCSAADKDNKRIVHSYRYWIVVR
jgi:hypothetical protein